MQPLVTLGDSLASAGGDRRFAIAADCLRFSSWLSGTAGAGATGRLLSSRFLLDRLSRSGRRGAAPVAEHQRPLLIRERGRLAAMGVGKLGGFFDVLDQIGPGGGEPLVGLRLCAAFDQRLNDAGGRDLLAATVEDLLLQLSDQGISLVAELDGELRHDAEKQLSHL